MEALIQDVAYAVRVLVKRPGFTAAVVVSLALGIGANTAIFSLMDAVMWRMLPVKDPERLLVAGRQLETNVETGFNYNQYRLLHDDNPDADLASYTTAPLNASVDDSLEPTLRGHLVSGDYFPLLGVAPIVGRAIGREDDRVPNGHPVAMLSYGYWERRFARDPLVIGRQIRLSGTPFTIIGVTPPEFFGVEVGAAADLFLPIAMQPTLMPAFENLLQDPIVNRSWVQVLVRLKPAVSLGQAEGRLTTRLSSDAPALRGAPPVKVVLNPASALSDLRRQFSRPLFALMAMVGVVLLIACANTANLLLARAAARQPEFAMRLALGAGRGRLLRQLLVEGVVLAGLAGVVGVVLARWTTRLLVVYMSSGRTPIELDLNPNLRILVFTAVVSILTGVVFGLAPALRVTRIDLTPALKNLSSSLTHGRGGLRPAKFLAVAQVTLSLLLLVAAGLFVRSLQNLNGEDTGVPRDQVVIIRVEPKGSDQRNIPGTTARLDRTYRGLLERVRQIHGVHSAGMAQVTPTGGAATAGASVTFASGEKARVPLVMVYPDYFGSIGIPVIAGREFTTTDLAEESKAVCVVNEAFARRVFPAENPLGKPCLTARRPRVRDTDQAGYGGEPEAYEIVGVVQDSRYANPRGGAEPVIYTTFLQTGTGRGQMVLHVRLSGSSGDLIPRIRDEVWKLDPTVPMFDVHTLDEEMSAALVEQRVIAVLSSLFGALSLLMASVGLYGLLAFAVVQRRGEMGIRMALGARRVDVGWLVTREAFLLVALGVAVGVPAALGLARLVSNQISGFLFGLEGNDPLTIAVATTILIGVAAFAAYLPARRASLVDPMVALRSE